MKLGKFLFIIPLFVSILSNQNCMGQVEKLAQYIPENVNAVVILNVDGMHNSELGVKENWVKMHMQNHQSGASSIPPNVKQLIVAANLEPSSMDSNWKVGIASLQNQVSLESLAKRELGNVDTIDTKEFVWSPRNIFYAKLDSKTVGMMTPTNRQDFSHWLQAVENKRPAYKTPYITNAINIAENEGQLVMAIDLSNFFSPMLIKRYLQDYSMENKVDLDVDACSKCIASLKGITFAARVTDGIVGKVQVDFGHASDSLKEIGQDLLQSVFRSQGIYVSEFSSWKYSAKENHISISGSLSLASMKEIFSLVEVPTHTLDKKSSDENFEIESTGDAVAKASKEYFDAVQGIIKDVKHSPSQTMGQRAAYHDRYAQKIEFLPILNVDEELLDYGYAVAERLRNVAGTIRGANIKGGVERVKAGGPNNNSGYYNGYGYYGDGGSDRRYNQRVAAKETKAEGNKRRVEEMQMIDQMTADIRRVMVDRYQIEF